MRLQQLQCILEVARHRSISSAARTLYMGQTTLSSSIRTLEQELGVVIFERKSDGIETTEEGKLVLELAEIICNKYACIQDLGSKSDDYAPITMNITIGVEAFLPGMMTRVLKNREEAIQIHYNKVSSIELSQLITNNQFEVAVSYIGRQRREYIKKLSEKYGVHIKQLASDKLYLVVRSDHPFADRKNIEVSEIQHMNIAGIPQYRTNPMSIVFEQRMGYTNRYTTMPSVAMMKRAVLEENMAAIMTGYAAAFDNTVDGEGLQRIELTDPEKINESALCIVYRDVWANTRKGKLVLDCVDDIFIALEEMQQ